MKVLFATTNPAKIERYANKLQKQGIEVLTLKNIDAKNAVNKISINKSHW